MARTSCTGGSLIESKDVCSEKIHKKAAPESLEQLARQMHNTQAWIEAETTKAQTLITKPDSLVHGKAAMCFTKMHSIKDKIQGEMAEWQVSQTQIHSVEQELVKYVQGKPGPSLS
eukprot:Gb_10468 [translate_table: standard]